ncbi:hypothetical protein CVT24_009882 [Panaeolus cyanescens]|uniref:Uncharacterized protein n=1 Tax=Panaeolus cyanescens TaxID=181874 RepID=A0A409WF83_9AGAR|nr:hypothetical protein CVT24_009882 [Panaeolus cyanescens]
MSTPPEPSPSRLGSRASRRNRRPWSVEETQQLHQAVEKHGTGNWAKILQDTAFESLRTRKRQDLRIKYRNETKKGSSKIVEIHRRDAGPSAEFEVQSPRSSHHRAADHRINSTVVINDEVADYDKLPWYSEMVDNTNSIDCQLIPRHSQLLPAWPPKEDDAYVQQQQHSSSVMNFEERPFSTGNTSNFTAFAFNDLPPDQGCWMDNGIARENFTLGQDTFQISAATSYWAGDVYNDHERNEA